MSNIAIEFNNVGKQYRLGRVGTGTLGHDLNRWFQTSIMRREDPYLKIGETNDRTTKGQSDYVWALRDISFKVEQGDVVGIIGKNGAGKSTLLKLLSHITAPSTGTIKYKGRIASLLEVGTGFHPEMTGRENIYMNGSIMGMTRREITGKLDEIVDFAGVERYLDTPVKRYSSGMTVRLGFAVAAFLEPEILVVDEVLTVGDAEFQKKAIGKMGEVSSKGGRTVLFVSHNMNAVKNLCHSGVVLKNGMVSHIGSAVDCVNYYAETSISELTQYAVVNNGSHRPCRDSLYQKIEIIDVRILADNANMSTDQEFPLEINVQSHYNKPFDTVFTVIFANEQDVKVSRFDTPIVTIPAGDRISKVNITIPYIGLCCGRYNVFIEVGDKNYNTGCTNYDAADAIVSFEVKYQHKLLLDEYVGYNPEWGLNLNLAHNIDIQVN